jgi:hypothetical protein
MTGFGVKTAFSRRVGRPQKRPRPLKHFRDGINMHQIEVEKRQRQDEDYDA